MQTFCDNVQHAHVRLFLDSKVAIKYLTKMGGRKIELNSLAKYIWEWCINKDIWISVFHIPGKDNYVVDNLSRKNNEDMEWALSDEVFDLIQHNVGPCDIDLFVSRKKS